MISPDLPITKSSEDRLSRESFAASLADYIVSEGQAGRIQGILLRCCHYSDPVFPAANLLCHQHVFHA